MENPADLVTRGRGVSARELVQSNLWLTGQAFLLGGLSRVSLSQIPAIICREELYPSTTTTTALVTKSVDGCLEPSRCRSTLGKAMQVMVWILRFGHNAREPQKSRVSGALTFGELSTAKLKLLLYVQQQEFGSEICDDIWMLRLGVRSWHRCLS